MGKLFGMPDLHISLAAEALFRFGSFTVTNSMVMMLITMVVLVWFFRSVAGKAPLQGGNRWHMLGETIAEALLGLVESVAGKKHGRQIFPLIATLFLFILFANWLALLPGVGVIGHYEEAALAVTAEAQTVGAKDDHGAAKTAAKDEHATVADDGHGKVFVPWLRAANADLNMTIAMALIAVVFVQYTGVHFHGVGGYLKEMATPPFLFPVHLISELSRILSLSARLFGNIFGGEVFLMVIFLLMPLLAPLIPLGLELFFGFVQAVLFSVLTLVYVSMAAAGHGGHGPDEEAHGAESHGGQHAAAHH